MAQKTGKDGNRRLSPREVLRRFYEPRPTRRQVLGGLLVGAVSARCSEAQNGSNSAPTDGMPAPADMVSGVDPSVLEPMQPATGTEVPGPAVEPQPMVPGVVEPQNPTDPAAMQPASPAEPMEAMPSEPASPVEPMDVTDPTPSEPMEMGEEPSPSTVTSNEPAPTEPVQPSPSTPMGRTAYDLVELGSTGIVTSRLAMGSGTTGYNGSSAQARMGAAFTELLVQGFDRGIRFFETADAYGSHRFIGEAAQLVGRPNVTILTKTMAETREEAERDLERFMEELGTDYIDIVLLHIRESATWVTESEGAMEVLAEAKARGQIRAHGVSCHTLAALELAAQTDWVDLDLARINPFQLHMDSDPDTVKGILEGMKAGGKAVLGMKILGQGDAVDRFDEAVEHATRLDCIHGFTIGFTAVDQLDQVAERIAATTMG